MEEEFRDFFYGEDHVRGSSPGCSSSSSSPAAEIVYQTVRREIYAGPNSRKLVRLVSQKYSKKEKKYIVHTNAVLLLYYLGPDHLESKILNILDKKI